MASRKRSAKRRAALTATVAIREARVCLDKARRELVRVGIGAERPLAVVDSASEACALAIALLKIITPKIP